MAWGKQIAIFENTAEAIVGRLHAHDDRIQWAGCRLFDSHTMRVLLPDSSMIIPPRMEHFHAPGGMLDVPRVSMDHNV
ncbi:MAG: hypothetical protein M1294_04130 [Firmicutes bacterium]|uniref:Uncharacterized protein n=1 Tax=Sulfobacillus benefaciens TaxID=453960 RepID=A0A2T2X4G4_9FIRM|nr:hypothetical protein [Bacillota bacterium]MCL5013714.1 hypothetical protein [Bacillota bacterium]PSR29390.1 MAG: hypothetical protein C7B43_08600 [Sulfobacillus benefaciens]HBQ95003.1 hypothetical protein [Sulfobacillus sp.]